MSNSLFRIARLCNPRGYIFRNLSTNVPSIQNTISPVITQATLVQNLWIWQKNNAFQLPVAKKSNIELPNGLVWVPPIADPVTEKVIEAPSTPDSDITKHAVRMIVIRRKKMKKHKLKKLRKRMKYVNAKIRQRREWQKEKLFQGGLIKQCKEAETFSAQQYVEERIKKLEELIAYEKSLQEATKNVK